MRCGHGHAGMVTPSPPSGRQHARHAPLVAHRDKLRTPARVSTDAQVLALVWYFLPVVSRREGESMSERRREFLISRGWIQAVLLVVLFGFFVLGLLAYRTYQAKPPVPIGCRPRRDGSLHQRRRQAGTEGLSQPRPHGVRVGLRARRLSRARLHGGLPAPRVGPRHTAAMAARPRIDRHQFDRRRRVALRANGTVPDTTQPSVPALNAVRASDPAPTRQPAAANAVGCYRPDSRSPCCRRLRTHIARRSTATRRSTPGRRW